ncbi:MULTISPECIES: TIGR01459 family HAD-type hydrolase [Parachlamydia]|jgi:HAD superfamily hydrolase (TIGR01459 family)|uniref:TIGR01459 family HAD-type hydrolase n=1 Tax=Parachlamydia TaxID=83551 RepID=UPI0001C173EF|nr:TIGR01459 family HAD-type hydrolase [Parachlamydia acanthamoebae]EFB41100.1 hypothetical protein pah_c050o059 [Parachlamydia acanthamoebae str. Hall's coccus]
MNEMPFPIYPSLSHIVSDFRGVLLDAYGVFWGGNSTGLIPGAKEAMEHLVASGKVVGVLSNSTQLASKEIKKLEGHGILEGKHFHFLVTSGEITREIFLNEALPFQTNYKKFWVFGGIHPHFSSHELIFQGTAYRETSDLDEADFIYTGIPHIEGEDQEDPEIFRQKIQEVIKKKLTLICSNPDRFAHEGNPPKPVVRQGSIAAIYEELGGSVFYIGKPYPTAYAKAIDCFAQNKIHDLSEILMVGDTPETDIRGARQCGIPSALILQTGMMRDRIASQGLENAIKNLSDHPNFFIGRLGDI